MTKLKEYSIIIYEKLTEKLTKFIHNVIPDKDIEKTSILFWVISIVIIIAVIWGFIARIEQVVRAPGTVIPASKIQVVQSVYSGVITKISVKLGDEVKKDDFLFSIDETTAESEYISNEQAYEATLLEVETREKKVALIEDLVFQGAEAEMRLLDEQLTLVDAKRRLSQLSSRREALKLMKDRSIIRSPVDGVVSNVTITTEGQVIDQGQLLAEIVPKGQKLVIDAGVMPKDISFVNKGQKAKVSFTAYDPSVYGSFDGTVTEVSANTKQTSSDAPEVYSALIEINDMSELEDKGIKIQSGMVTDVSIIGQERTVLGYIFNPVSKLTREAFREQ